VATSLIAAGLAIVGALTVINLVVSYGVIRRLREHEQRFAERTGGQPDNLLTEAGGKVGDFAVPDLDGNPITLATFEGPTLAGFFSATCEPCAEVVPLFVATAAGWPGGARNVLAVVIDGGSEPGGYLDPLRAVATVVGSDHAEPVSQAFGLRGVPGICVIEPGGTVRAEGKRVLTASALAPA
jgi:hypothetical protein